MYWQVYLHKTGVAAEHMLINTLRRARVLALEGKDLEAPRHLHWFLYRKPGEQIKNEELLSHFLRLDDNDITAAIKYWSESDDFILAFLSGGILDRRLFRLEWFNEPVSPGYEQQIREMVTREYGDKTDTGYLIITGSESNRAYDNSRDQIKILFKNGSVVPIDQCSDVPLYTQLVTKFFICYPKIRK
jgi:HD superfamily phosphohydrolase